MKINKILKEMVKSIIFASDSNSIQCMNTTKCNCTKTCNVWIEKGNIFDLSNITTAGDDLCFEYQEGRYSPLDFKVIEKPISIDSDS